MTGPSPLGPQLDLDLCLPHETSSFLCHDPNGSAFFVRNVYPPIQELQPKVLFVVIIFVLCFIVGICGNSSILTIIRGVVRERRARGSRRPRDNAILYIAALCLCDLATELSLPPAVLDSIIGFWMFGTAICKLHHICGSVGRVLSTFLITAMSFDRFVAVCHPHQHRFRSRKFVLSTIACLCTFAFVLLLPMLTYARANEMILHQLSSPESPNITRVRVFKCSDMMPSLVFYWFTCRYLSPLPFTSQYFPRWLRRSSRAHCLFQYEAYQQVVPPHKVREVSSELKKDRVLPRSGIPLRRVVVYTAVIACWCFVCWTPYWCSVLYAIYMAVSTDGKAHTSELVLFIIYCVHLLPYFGSASNWVLYGLLNTQLQMKHDGGNTEDHATSVLTVNNKQQAPVTEREESRWETNEGRDSNRVEPRQERMLLLQSNGNGFELNGALDVTTRESSLNFLEESDATHL